MLSKAQAGGGDPQGGLALSALCLGVAFWLSFLFVFSWQGIPRTQGVLGTQQALWSGF